MADLFCADEFTPADKLKAAEREVGLREYVYRRRVAEGKMDEAEAKREIGVMKAIAEDYRKRVGHGDG
jgi:hypothetical protein